MMSMNTRYSTSSATAEGRASRDRKQIIASSDERGAIHGEQEAPTARRRRQDSAAWDAVAFEGKHGHAGAPATLAVFAVCSSALKHGYRHLHAVDLALNVVGDEQLEEGAVWLSLDHERVGEIER
eukprot:1349039-Pleurochrysis_carterae.AAC.2